MFQTFCPFKQLYLGGKNICFEYFTTFILKIPALSKKILLSFFFSKFIKSQRFSFNKYTI